MSNRQFRVFYQKADGSLCEIRVENFKKGWRVQVLEGGEETCTERGLSNELAMCAFKARNKETLDQGYQIFSEETFSE